jgi:four helix bundle protein
VRRKHRDLLVWQRAIELVEMVYGATEGFPPSERYGLCSQLRRAAVSVPANIAEGYARSGTRELLHYLSISAGSLTELDTLIELGQRLGYFDQTEELRKTPDDVSGMLMGLQASVRRRAGS